MQLTVSLRQRVGTGQDTNPGTIPDLMVLDTDTAVCRYRFAWTGSVNGEPCSGRVRRTNVIVKHDAFGATEPRRRSKRRLKAAQFPRDKSVRSFDANPNVDPAVIHTLAAKLAPLPDSAPPEGEGFGEGRRLVWAGNPPRTACVGG